MDPRGDCSFLNQVLGRELKITLVCGTFEGILQHVDPSRSIVLKKVKNVETGRSVPGVKMFFGHEIKNVEMLNEEDRGAARGTGTPDGSGDGSGPAEETHPAWKKQALVRRPGASANPEGTRLDRPRESERSQGPPTPAPLVPETAPLRPPYKYNPGEDGEVVAFTVIDQFQQRFSSAMTHIKKQSVLSVAAEGVPPSRHGTLCWLQVATTARVYLFDIHLLGHRAFENGLRLVLEDRGVLKVTHDCRWLSDCLAHQYGIVLANVFDTQVADVLQFSRETGGYLPHRVSTLQESLMRHLKLPAGRMAFLGDRQRLIEENAGLWLVRPLPPALPKALALEAAYLLPLRLALLDGTASDLTALVDGYLHAFREKPADPPGGLEASCSELPEEPRPLTDQRTLRRERAVRAYGLDAEGLPVRPRPRGPAETEEAPGGRGGQRPPGAAAAVCPRPRPPEGEGWQRRGVGRRPGGRPAAAPRPPLPAPEEQTGAGEAAEVPAGRKEPAEAPRRPPRPRLSLQEEIERLLKDRGDDPGRPRRSVGALGLGEKGRRQRRAGERRRPGTGGHDGVGLAARRKAAPGPRGEEQGQRVRLGGVSPPPGSPRSTLHTEASRCSARAPDTCDFTLLALGSFRYVFPGGLGSPPEDAFQRRAVPPARDAPSDVGRLRGTMAGRPGRARAGGGGEMRRAPCVDQKK
ncbi:piRNA biogenesis protein EXD1 [Ornithorhynchus anatinus]|uniref:piRNA biogenesis protein EXD1 n=1 Tax=Ornithorhynchus anatinus TaxID=9258 RepID=UPI0010A7E077|nr:piRNA biogenesis protein EXD1 [Ornithorhynchus anatinus]